MTQEQFVKHINLMQSYNAKIDQLRDLGIDLIESPLFIIPAQMFDNFIESVCTEEGADLVFWWIYEDVEKIIIETLENGEEKTIHLDTVYQLYNYLDENDLFSVV